MRERRMAEVVPGAERLRDPGARERRGAGSGARACEGSSGVPSAGWQKTSDSSAAVAARLPVLLEDGRGAGPSSIVRRDARALGRLNWPRTNASPDVQAALEQLHVAPAEREQLAAAEGRPERDLDERAGRAATSRARARRPLAQLAVGGESRAISASVETCISGGSTRGGSTSTSGLGATSRQRRATLNITRRRPRWLLIVFGERPAPPWRRCRRRGRRLDEASGRWPKNGRRWPRRVR